MKTKKKIRTFHSEWGKDYFIVLEKTSYQYGGGLGIIMWRVDKVGRRIEQFDIMTTNIPGYHLPKDEAFVDTNNLSGIMAFIKDEKLGEKVGEGHSGFCSYPIVKFNMEELEA